MTGSDGHGDLPGIARETVRWLGGLQYALMPASVGHLQHTEFANRCRLLADQLSAILDLGAAGRYAPALSLTRTALEHHLLDRLLLLADRWVQVEKGVKKAGAAAEGARLAALRAGPRPDIDRWWWDDRDGAMKVVVRGLYAQGSLGKGPTISPYYFRVRDYDPFTVDRPLTGRLALGFAAGMSTEAHERSLRAWYQHFTYERLRENLLVNRLLTRRGADQVDVHHAFLSAFTHPSQAAYEEVYGRNLPTPYPRYDHAASEIVLLYSIALGAAELETFLRMAWRSPRVGIRRRGEIVAELRSARAAVDYFWFLGGAPQPYDRIQEADTRAGFGPTGATSPRPDPASIPDRGVRYYPQPLDRLRRLHESYREISTGQIFISPFETR